MYIALYKLLQLSNYETLNEMQSNGKLKQLVVAGIVPVKIFTHLDVYRLVDMRMKTGSKKMEAVAEASVSFRVCESSVFKIIRGLK